MGSTILIKTSDRLRQSRSVLSVVSMFRFYFIIRVVEAAYRLHLVAFGVRPPICFDEPWKSKTIAEFWTRWNLSIAQQLRAIFYKPVLERGYRQLAEFSVFISSALLHLLPIYVLGGSTKAKRSTALFFLCQPVLIMFERKFKLQSRLWVQLALWSVAPLFSLPLHQVTG